MILLIKRLIILMPSLTLLSSKGIGGMTNTGTPKLAPFFFISVEKVLADHPLREDTLSKFVKTWVVYSLF
jgi:hypothetical protein